MYFGGENITKIAEYSDELKCYVATVEIEENGDYPLWFVNNNTNAITATVTYSIDGFDDSNSTWIAVICIIVAVIAVVLLVSCHLRPYWSKGSKARMDELPQDDDGEVI